MSKKSQGMKDKIGQRTQKETEKELLRKKPLVIEGRIVVRKQKRGRRKGGGYVGEKGKGEGFIHNTKVIPAGGKKRGGVREESAKSGETRPGSIKRRRVRGVLTFQCE